MRDRVYQGASFAAFAPEGWVIELWLAAKGRSLEKHPAVAALVAAGKLTTAADEELAKVLDGRVDVGPAFEHEADTRRSDWDGVKVLFREGYARAFFEEEGRSRLVGLSGRLAEATGAEMGALYGRCAHLRVHDVGAWFYGRDPQTAAASILYQMGFFAESSLVNKAALAAIAPSEPELGRLLAVAATQSSNALVGALAAEGGTAKTTHGVSVTFPFAGATRAITATRELAEKLGIGVR
jgi:serine/threonine-protein kinase